MTDRNHPSFIQRFIRCRADWMVPLGWLAPPGRLLLLALVVGLLLIAPAKPVRAATSDDFESAENSWRPGDADVQYRVENHARINSDPHSGQRSELLQISAGAGTYVYFTHDLGTARIVAELTPSVWVKANRPGIQLFARVVLPHTPDPRTGQPTSALLSGSSYTTVGMWQQLNITDTPQLLSREVRTLRAQLGPQVDAREAYIDQLLLNVYGGPGQTIVNIDDLAVAGVVPFSGPIQPASLTSTDPRAAQPGSPQLNPQTNSLSVFATAPSAAGAPLTPSPPTNFNAAPPPDFSAPFNSTPATASPRQVVVNGSLLMVDGRPMFPRIIQSQGEPLSLLAQAGFNTVHITGPVTAETLAEAQRLGLKLICPPPLAAQPTDGANPVLAPITAAYSPVLAWHLGSGLAARELPATAALAKQTRFVDRQLRRPLVCSPEEESLAYSRQTDILCQSRAPLGTSMELADYATWLGQRPRLARPGTPLWAVVQTEPAPALLDQAAALLGQSQLTAALEPSIQPGSLRLLTYLAFCSGVRGLEFASSSRLDAADLTTRLRATQLALLNLELDLMEPWGAAGTYVTYATSSDPNITAVVLNADKARLVVAMRLNPGSQIVPTPDISGTGIPTANYGGGPAQAATDSTSTASLLAHKAKPSPVPDLKDSSHLLEHTDAGINMSDANHDSTFLPSANRNPLFPDAVAPSRPGVTTLVVPGIPEDYQVYEITVAGLRPLRHQVITGGTAIAIEDFLLTSQILITANPTVITDMQQRTTQTAPRAAQLQRQLTNDIRDQTAALAQRLPNPTSFPSVTKPLTTAQAGLQQADAYLSAGQFAQAYLAARNASYPLERWQHDVWSQAVKPLTTPVASPLAVSLNTLPEQINFAAATSHLPNTNNLLVGGDFEDLSAMLQAGWQHSEHARADLQTSVELSPTAPYAGGHSLHLAVQSAQPEKAAALAAQLVESPPLWVTSAPVHVNTGDIVCIHGQLRVLQPIIGSVDGLMILDSFGGEALAQRISQTDGWREFTLYRAAPHADNFTVTFALTGIGEAYIDDLSIRPVRRTELSGEANLMHRPTAMR